MDGADLGAGKEVTSWRYVMPTWVFTSAVLRSLVGGTGSVAILAREWGELGTVRGQL